MKFCKACGKEFAENAAACPNCGALNPKPIYKRAWFYVLVAIALVAMVSWISSSSKDFDVQVNTADGVEVLKASELTDIAQEDSVTFERKYYGEIVTFTATIRETHGRTNCTNIGTTYVCSYDFDKGLVTGLNYTGEFAVGDKVTVVDRIAHSVYGTVYVDCTSMTLAG